MGLYLVTVKPIAHDSYDIIIRTFSESSCPVDVGRGIVELSTPIRIEMFYDKVKLISQNNFILIYRKSSL